MADLPQGCTARYRIMTERSRMGFGKYADLTVGDVLRLDETYIPFAYYTCGMVSFCDDILDALQLTRIPKPGTDPEAWRRWKQDFFAQMSDEEAMRFHAHLKSMLKARAVSAKCRAERYSNMTAGQRQAYNLRRLGRLK